MWQGRSRPCARSSGRSSTSPDASEHFAADAGRTTSEGTLERRGVGSRRKTGRSTKRGRHERGGAAAVRPRPGPARRRGEGLGHRYIDDARNQGQIRLEARPPVTTNRRGGDVVREKAARQHELVEEMLGVDGRACVAQYVASVYTTTPLRDRADVIVRAIEQLQGVGTLSGPIRDLEDASAGALPDLGVFLPLWV